MAGSSILCLKESTGAGEHDVERLGRSRPCLGKTRFGNGAYNIPCTGLRTRPLTRVCVCVCVRAPGKPMHVCLYDTYFHTRVRVSVYDACSLPGVCVHM